MKYLILALTALHLSSCLNSEAQEQKKITANMTNGQFQCRTMGAIEPCGVRLYDCTDGARRFDVVCAVGVTIERW